MDPATQLGQGLARLGLQLPATAQARLMDYLALLQKWNRTYNLTAVREPSRMVSHHLLDCLAVVPHIRAPRVLDVGSGAGLPGIPLAVAEPRVQVTLLESSEKKAAFLRQAKAELALDNVTVVCDRAQAWQGGQLFETVVSRALSDLAEFIALAGRHLAAAGRLAAMKGVCPHEELARLPAGWRLREAIALTIPGVHAQRHLLLLERA